MFQAYGDSFHSAHRLRLRVQELGRLGYQDYRFCSKQTKLSGSAERYLIWSGNDADPFLSGVAWSVCKGGRLGTYYKCALHEDIYCMKKLRD